MTAKGYTKEELLEAGLLSQNRDKGTLYDRFRNRLMFPIIDVRGNVIGFGGRVMDDSTPKYLNSPETIIFNKRRNLFAMNVVKKSKREFIILTEGYMDAIALHQYGFDCAVASLGTSLTQEHAALAASVYHDGDGAYIRDRIEHGALFGVFESDALAGFAGFHDNGGMGMLEILPAVRRRGYAAQLGAFLIAAALKEGRTPYCHVVDGNEASLHLQRKMGLTCTRLPAIWVN